MAADVIYEAQVVPALFQTAARYILPSSGIFYLSYTKRNVSIDYVLAQAQVAGFQWQSQSKRTDHEGIYVFTLMC